MRFNWIAGLVLIGLGAVVGLLVHPFPGVLLVVGGVLITMES